MFVDYYIKRISGFDGGRCYMYYGCHGMLVVFCNLYMIESTCTLKIQQLAKLIGD